MIYTVTFNPSIDYTADVPDFMPGRVNRAAGENILPGGKGINVSTVLRNLGADSTALGFTAGFTGDAVENLLRDLHVRTDFIRLPAGFSRINVLIRAGEETKVNGAGPDIPENALQELLAKLDGLSDGDVLVLAGSIPESLPDSIYMDIMKRLTGKQIRTVVDATGDLLLNVLPYHPFAVKPNRHELGEIFGTEIRTWEEAVPYARKLQERGAENVIVSMGHLGAMMVTADGQVFHERAADLPAVNTVGAGDSFVAGFLYGWETCRDYEKAFYIGNAAGGASASMETLATRDRVREVLRSFGRNDLD